MAGTNRYMVRSCSKWSFLLAAMHLRAHGRGNPWILNLIPEMINQIDERILSWLVFGAMLVLMSVILMSLSDLIQLYIDSCRRNKEKDEQKMSNLAEENEAKLLNEKEYMED